MPGVTAENYVAATIAFATMAGNCFMIDPGMHAERQAWARYYNLKGMDSQARKMRWWLEGEHGFTRLYAVPSQWPEQFDQSVERIR